MSASWFTSKHIKSDVASAKSVESSSISSVTSATMKTGLHVRESMSSIAIRSSHSTCLGEDNSYQKQEMSDDDCYDPPVTDDISTDSDIAESEPVIVIQIASDATGYDNLVNAYKESKRPALEPSRVRKRFSMDMVSNVGTDFTNLLRNRTDDKFYSTRDLVIDDSCMNSTIQTIVDNDLSWNQIIKRMKDARLVTCFGIHEVCSDFIKDKEDEFREERIASEANTLRERQISKLRKRLTVF
eukprot:scaffold2540_cov204-Chaetoceros_neogracile.AAC.3